MRLEISSGKKDMWDIASLITLKPRSEVTASLIGFPEGETSLLRSVNLPVVSLIACGQLGPALVGNALAKRCRVLPSSKVSDAAPHKAVNWFMV